MAILISDSVTPSWNFIDTDKNELNEEKTHRTIAILNMDQPYSIWVSDFPINKDWHMNMSDTEIRGTSCKSLGDCISYLEHFINMKYYDNVSSTYYGDLVTRFNRLMRRCSFLECLIHKKLPELDIEKEIKKEVQKEIREYKKEIKKKEHE